MVFRDITKIVCIFGQLFNVIPQIYILQQNPKLTDMAIVYFKLVRQQLTSALKFSLDFEFIFEISSALKDDIFFHKELVLWLRDGVRYLIMGKWSGLEFIYD